MDRTIGFAWKDSSLVSRFRSGVCLHGHTLHSEECLDFLPGYLHKAPVVSQIVSGYQQGPQQINFARAFWTPPMSPAAALRLERKQIEALRLRPLVSLTDHDTIEAGMSLQVAADPREVPVSVEWTVPYARSIFHFGIHNLPPASAREIMSMLTAFTVAPDEDLLPGLLRGLAQTPDVLVVLNHPLWLEEGITRADHDIALPRLLRECNRSIHAFELNGTRGWKENLAVIELAQMHNRPLISGGDRHACEPSACINLTNAASFAEFVAEIRQGVSMPYFMPHYREPMALRIIEMAWDVLRPYPGQPGRERWTDRIFYRDDDGVTRSLTELWRKRTPWVMTAPLKTLTAFLRLLAAPELRFALRPFLTERGEILP